MLSLFDFQPYRYFLSKPQNIANALLVRFRSDTHYCLFLSVFADVALTAGKVFKKIIEKNIIRLLGLQKIRYFKPCFTSECSSVVEPHVATDCFIDCFLIFKM